ALLCDESPIADVVVSETRPGSAVQSDDEIVDSALDQGYCGYHAVGTCAMGPNDHDVVDPTLRVRGVDRLRVMDCSVMPTMVSGNLNGPAMAMAWQAAGGALGPADRPWHQRAPRESPPLGGPETLVFVDAQKLDRTGIGCAPRPFGDREASPRRVTGDLDESLVHGLEDELQCRTRPRHGFGDRG